MKQWKRLTGLAAKGKAADARTAERASGTPAGAQQAGRTGRMRSSSVAEGIRGMAVTQTDSIEDEFQQGLQEVGEMRDKYERLLAAVADAQERAAGALLECAEALHQLAAVVADAFGGVEEGGAGDTLLAAAAVDGRLAELLYFHVSCSTSMESASPFNSSTSLLPTPISLLTPFPCVCQPPAALSSPPWHMPTCPQSLHLQQTLAEPAEALPGEMQHVVLLLFSPVEAAAPATSSAWLSGAWLAAGRVVGALEAGVLLFLMHGVRMSASEAMLRTALIAAILAGADVAVKVRCGSSSMSRMANCQNYRQE
ncbi:unnamed protein product [Closterium sp. Naga37s-1]|nr:unnamed protein product [Closterium sp. Naga37s-1]